MPSHVTRDRLVFPVAAVLVFGLVSVAPKPGAEMTVPQLTEVSAVRLQADVTSLVTGMVDTVGEELPAAAASTLTATGVGPTVTATVGPTPTGTVGPTATASCTYPCTIFDKFLSSLPEDVLYAILPTVYVFASVLGLVLAPITLVTSALFGWPNSLRPAAAVAPETSPAPAEATPVESDPSEPHADPVASSTVPGETVNASVAAVESAPLGDNDGPVVRGHRIDRTPTESAEISVSAEASEAITAVEDGASIESQLPGARGRSAEPGPATETGPSDSAPAPQRAAKRSAR